MKTRLLPLTLFCALITMGGCESGIVKEPVRQVVTATKSDDLDMLAIRPAYSNIQGLGGHRTLILRAWLNGGGPQDVSAEDWTSENPAVASVDASGSVTGLAVGETLIRARYRGEEASAWVIVEAAASPQTDSAPNPTDPNDGPPNDSPNDEPDDDGTPVDDDPPDGDPPPADEPCQEDPPPSPESPFADRVVSHVTGSGGGFHENLLPGVVLGPPKGAGPYSGSLDVFSLGVGGEIVLEFTDHLAVDCEGADFIVFENAFQVGTDPDLTFAEPGVVSASENGKIWVDFPCNLGAVPYRGCAGVHPTLANPDTNDIDPTDPSVAGGDAFDLADVGLKRVRFIKIQDSGLGLGPIGPGTRGFDLDAVVIVHGTSP